MGIFMTAEHLRSREEILDYIAILKQRKHNVERELPTVKTGGKHYRAMSENIHDLDVEIETLRWVIFDGIG